MEHQLTLKALKGTDMKYIALISLIFIAGCFSQPKIEATQSWENHYFTIEEFRAGTENMKLEKGESIWVLSNKTLKKTLQNVKGN